jgi:hypothetical protein
VFELDDCVVKLSHRVFFEQEAEIIADAIARNRDGSNRFGARLLPIIADTKDIVESEPLPAVFARQLLCAGKGGSVGAKLGMTVKQVTNR